MMRLVVLLCTLLFCGGLHAQTPIECVDPFIGTTNFGATNPGAVTPHGMMSVVPFNVMGSKDNLYDKDERWWSAPYEYYNTFFTGFAHVTLSGVGCPDLGSLLTMPISGELQVDYHKYGSPYSGQTASPGYYGTILSKYGIHVEATAAPRSSIERYTFPAGEGHILLNLGEGLTNESGAMVRRVNDCEIEGMKLMGTFCYNPQAIFPVYFVMRVSKRPSATGYWKMQPSKQGVEAEWDKDAGQYKLYTRYGREIAGDDIGYYFSYGNLVADEQIEVRMGVSFVSIDNARMNLEAEQREQSFEEVLTDAKQRWSEELNRVSVEGGTAEQRKIFYTALYHALIHPNILSDVNGDYPMMESSETGNSSSTRYTVFSLWDTYRNLHPLLALVYPERQTEMLQSMVGMYREWGWLPKWELYGRETFTMSGDPATMVLVDSWMKGLRNFDIDAAYEAMCKSATMRGGRNLMRPENDLIDSLGYIPLGSYAADLSGDNSVSNALEYYMADNALALLADSLGNKNFAAQLRKRSLGYRHYYCKQTGTLRPITSTGVFLTPFDPRQGENFEQAPGFHEGSAWNYTFFVPHDIMGLARLMGGNRLFVEKLQRVFDEKLYDPANEPDIAYPYLFSRFKGEEWRTQREVKRLLAEHFTSKPNGIPGNDDTGTMSAWVIFSMIGLYPDCPGEPYYTITTPSFDRIVIHIPNGDIEISKHGNEDYIRSIKIGGKPTSYRIAHSELIKRKKLTIQTYNR